MYIPSIHIYIYIYLHIDTFCICVFIFFLFLYLAKYHESSARSLDADADDDDSEEASGVDDATPDASNAKGETATSEHVALDGLISVVKGDNRFLAKLVLLCKMFPSNMQTIVSNNKLLQPRQVTHQLCNAMNDSNL